MKNWFIMLGIDVLIPLLMMLFGWLIKHKTPRKNAIYGYRTSIDVYKRQVTDAESRKRGEQTGLDTLVVHAVNDEC